MKRPRFSFFFTTIFLMHIVEAISAIFCLHTLNIKTEIGKVKGWKIPVQFSRLVVSNSCDPMDCSMPGLHIHHQLLEVTQTYAHWVSDAIQPSHPPSSPSPSAFNLSQHQGLFKWVISLHQVAKLLKFQLQYQSFQWIFRNDFL